MGTPKSRGFSGTPIVQAARKAHAKMILYHSLFFYAPDPTVCKMIVFIVQHLKNGLSMRFSDVRYQKTLSYMIVHHRQYYG